MTTNPCYLMPCGCGRKFAVEPSEAGAFVSCPWCQAAIEVPRLTRLRELPLVAGLVEERRPLQFGLRHLFALVTYIASALACGKYLGFLAAAIARGMDSQCAVRNLMFIPTPALSQA